MSYKGTVKNGVVVLPPGAQLPDGTPVEVIADEWRPEDDPFIAAVLKVAKPRPYCLKDYARNLDHLPVRRSQTIVNAAFADRPDKTGHSPLQIASLSVFGFTSAFMP